MLPFRKLQRGFTLIEMLVVIAIISILIGIGINTFTIAQKKARDVKRKADLATLQKTLIAYSIDHNGSYCSGSPCATTLDFLVTDKYINALPSTPYTFFGNATGFTLKTTLENGADQDIKPAKTYSGLCATGQVVLVYCVASDS